MVSEYLSNVNFVPFWLDTPDLPEKQPRLSSDISTDLLIVGGGFTGLWAAVLAKEENPDRSIVLIEGKSIANGATGRLGAIVSTSVMHGLSNAERTFPEDISELERLGRENFDGYVETIKRHNIDCHADWGGEMTVALDEKGIGILREEYELHKRHGHDVFLLDKKQTQSEIASPLFQSGLWTKSRSGTIHPGRLAWGLKETALKLGIKIFEETPLTKMRRSDPGAVVRTPLAEITARRVLLATNAFAAGHSRIRSRVAAIRDRIITSEPLSKSRMDSLGWANRQGIYDTRTQMNYFRLTRDNRILFGGRLGYFYGNDTDPEYDKTAAPYEKLAQRFFHNFPQLEGVSFSHAWSGPVGLTTRMAVHFQKYCGGAAIYAGGYSGFGVTAARFGARIGLALLDNKDIPELRMKFARTEPSFIPPEPFRWLGARITIYAVDTQEEKGGWRTP